MTLDEVHAGAEKCWNVWGPCSGGGIVVYFYAGKLYTCYGGDAADENAPNPLEETIEEYVRGGGGNAHVLAWLRETGRLGG